MVTPLVKPNSIVIKHETVPIKMGDVRLCTADELCVAEVLGADSVTTTTVVAASDAAAGAPVGEPMAAEDVVEVALSER